MILVQAARRRSRDDTPTEQIEVEVVEDDVERERLLPDDGPESGRVRSMWAGILEPRSPALVYVGVALIALGFALTAYTWSRVAGLLAVPLQIPYVVSGGLTAIAFVVLGAMMISMGTARRDVARREARLEELLAVLTSITEILSEDDEESR